MIKTDFLSTIYEDSDDGVFVSDALQNLVYYNDVLHKILPQLPKKPSITDFGNVFNLGVDVEKLVTYDLFELDYFITVKRKQLNVNEQTFCVFNVKTQNKDSVEEKLSFFASSIDEILFTERLQEYGSRRISFISEGIARLAGYTPKEIIQDELLIQDVCFEDDKKSLENIIHRIHTELTPGRCQIRLNNNGNLIWVEVSIYPQTTSDGKHYANFGVIRDISKNVEADHLLRQSELKHRLLFSEANDAIMIFKGLEMVDCNEKTLNMFDSQGFVEISGKKLYELMPEKQPNGDDSILTYHNFMQKAIAGESQFFYWKHSKMNGVQFDTEVSINSFIVEPDTFVQVIVRDITERKIAEEQKNQSIKSYFEVFNSSSDLIFIVANDGRVLDVNQLVVSEFGAGKENLVGQSFDQLGELSVSNDKDYLKIGKSWTGEQQKFEWHFKANSNRMVPLEMILHPGTYFGKEVIIATGRDISERLEYEQILKESESKFRILANHAPIGIFLTDEKGKALYVNNRLKQLALIPSEKGFMKNWLEQVHPEDRERVKKHIDLEEKNDNQTYSYRVVHKKGEIKWIKAQVNLLKSESGKITGRVGTLEDITNEILSENLLKESERNYRQLVEILPDSILLHSQEQIEYLNPQAKTFLSANKGDSIFNLVSKENKKQLYAGIKNAIKGDNTPFFESELTINNKPLEIEVCCVPFIYNNIPVAKLVIHDITSRKRAEKEKLRAEFAEETTRRLKKEITERITAEQELKSAKEYNQYIINSSLDMIIATNTYGIITEFNGAAESNFGYFSTSLIGGMVDPLFADNQQREDILNTVFEHGQWSGEIVAKRADDSLFTAYLSASLIRNPDKKIIGTMGVLRDITDLKAAEEELKQNVHQKEVLLKEVHHRVKNNLQVISSILNLQTGYISDTSTLEIIKECQDRIKSMAFIHESLYQSADLAQVNFAEYLQNLTNNLKYSYMTPDRNIDLIFDIENISLSLDSAIPCGLIVNELVSNCFKYAFKNQSKGTIRIELRKENNNKKLVVHDSGVGLPKNLNIETNDSLGLQLVWTLVDQIDGKIDYEYTKGSKFVINFKRD